MSEPRYLQIRNFPKYQHYRDRKPPWIKLYRDLWRDDQFFVLKEADRYLLLSLMIVASQHENRVPLNLEWLSQECLTKVTWARLAALERHWIEIDASKMLASCKQDAIVETETETEIQRQKEREKAAAPPLAPEPYRIFGEFANVRLTDEEYTKLEAKLGSSPVSQYIEDLSRWGMTNPRKFATRKSHYATILVWYDRDLKAGKMGTYGERKTTAQLKEDFTAQNAERLLGRLAAQTRGRLPGGSNGGDASDLS